MPDRVLSDPKVLPTMRLVLLSADDDPETNGKGHLLKLGFRHGDHRGNDGAADLSLTVRVSRDVRIAGAGYTHPGH
jgi:hypothetical protein